MRDSSFATRRVRHYRRSSGVSSGRSLTDAERKAVRCLLVPHRPLLLLPDLIDWSETEERDYGGRE